MAKYKVKHAGKVCGPFSEEKLLYYCEKGTFSADTPLWPVSDPKNILRMDQVIDFDNDGGDDETAEIEADAEFEPEVSLGTSTSATACLSHKKFSEEGEIVPGENFRCPYCRVVSDLSDVLAVSVSPSLVGDPVLGDGEQKRFLPSHFNASGLPLDADGGVCLEIACPRCHMALPRALLDSSQIVMSIVGAAGAGKSVFLASSMWQCRTMLSRLFGISFMDLDPVANRWINAYEEKLFFQEDSTSLQQIQKTDERDQNTSKSVMLDGAEVLLPLPSFFRMQKDGEPQQSLVVYDSAGEHFRAGADTHSSSVTLNMLNADSLFFMFDPSADPRFRSVLDFGGGTAHNYAQRQDVLLAEMSARIRRHLGNRCESKLSRPLIFGVSKADLLREYLPLEAELYYARADGRYALNIDVLRILSETTENLLKSVVPEAVATARDIASEVWFLPVSALGHNPMKEGVRPCDITPVWTELPVVFTLAKRGLIPMVSSTGE